MKKLYFKAENIEQRNAIEGLAYWVANVNYIKERYGYNDPEFDRADKSVHLCFDTLDRLGVPFWVQNSVICFAENWRQYKQCYLYHWLLDNRNININPY